MEHHNEHISSSYTKALTIDDFNEKSKSIVSKFICSLCNGILYQPVIDGCNHLYCTVCLGEYFLLHKECPISNRPISLDEIKNATQVSTIIDSQIVKCKNKTRGCAWEGRVNHLSFHYDKACILTTVSCIHEGCTTRLKWNQYQSHGNKSHLIKEEVNPLTKSNVISKKCDDNNIIDQSQLKKNTIIKEDITLKKKKEIPMISLFNDELITKNLSKVQNEKKILHKSNDKRNQNKNRMKDEEKKLLFQDERSQRKDKDVKMIKEEAVNKTKTIIKGNLENIIPTKEINLDDIDCDNNGEIDDLKHKIPLESNDNVEDIVLLNNKLMKKDRYFNVIKNELKYKTQKEIHEFFKSFDRQQQDISHNDLFKIVKKQSEIINNIKEKHIVSHSAQQERIFLQRKRTTQHNLDSFILNLPYKKRKIFKVISKPNQPIAALNNSSDTISDQYSKDIITLYDFFDMTTIPNWITIKNNKAVSNSHNSDEHCYLFWAIPFTTTKNEVDIIHHWKIKANIRSSRIAFGICEKEKVISNNSVMLDNNKCNHATFGFDSAGYLMNGNNKKENGYLIKEFPKIEKDDWIYFTFHVNKEVLKFEIGNKYHGILTEVYGLERNFLTPCVIFFNEGDEIVTKYLDMTEKEKHI